ncbi:hypothetical protein Lal_00023296 [Lupinus albus]|nr:hypothetical protein Lal_00023296 [Lupinus albus]
MGGSGSDGMIMVWEDLTVELPIFGEEDSSFSSKKKKKLLNGLTGLAQPGKIMAVMGPSGSGKTTLLHSFSGRLPPNVIVTGSILMNRKKTNSYCKEVSYVAEEEMFLGTLTVRETLTYSANIRLPSKMSKEEINNVVEETIMKLGLEECANNTIGNWHLRGISNGEKKRVSIGLEILTQPHVLLLDEPTSGLDSASAFYVIQALTNIASNGKIVICSIHQPSSEIFNLFDHLLLLSNGETVYFGEANMALKEASSSYSAVGMRTAEIRATLIESYKCSELMINSRNRIQMLQPNLFYAERSKGHYGEAAFVLANIISSFPFLLVISLFSGVIIYFMVQFHPGATNLAFFCINLFCCLSVVESCIMIVASLVPNVLMGIGTGTGVIIFMMMPSQIFRRLPDIPKFFWRYPMSYLSFATWAMQGQYKNDMLGLEFDPLLPGYPKVSGEQVLTMSYVTQEDYFLGTLTVRETLTYAAHLRLPSNMTKDEINKMVTKILDEMGLQDCADCRIGNWHLRGISNGEKRRLSISIEILTQPHILLLDEPTSGLDSAASFYVISSLRSIAHNGRIVICSIHQPCSEVFNLFDDLFLLAAGETVFFGERTMAVKFFADAGFPCPTRKNPPEHFLRCISAEFDSVATLIQSRNIKAASSSWNPSMNKTTEEIKSELIKNYKNSMHSAKAREKIREIKQREVPLIGRTYDTSMLKQLCTLTQRSFLNMFRDIGYCWLRIVFYILVSGSAGFLYLNIGTGSGAILSRGKCDGFIYGFMAFLCLGGLPFFLEELKVFKRERFGRHYGEAVYVLSSFLSSFPFVLAISLSSGTILYHMMNFHPGFSHYFYFCINLLCCISVTEGCMLLVAALVSNLLLAIGTATGIIGQFKNDLIGLEFEPLVPGDAKIKGEVILQETYGISTDYSKWWDLGAIVCLLISYRLLFFLVLKHKERVTSLLHIKRTFLDIFLRRHSLKDKYISSKRHQSLYPLSAQEGLSS